MAVQYAVYMGWSFCALIYIIEAILLPEIKNKIDREVRYLIGDIHWKQRWWF